MKKYALKGSRFELVSVYGKHPVGFRKAWEEMTKRPMVKSSKFPWNMEQKMKERGYAVEIALVKYTYGADSTRWYEVTVK